MAQTINASAHRIDRVTWVVTGAAMQKTDAQIKIFIDATVAVVVDGVADLCGLFRDHTSILATILASGVEIMIARIASAH
jgi:hypothetical protein